MVFDISLPQGTLCTITVGGRDGGPPTQEEKDHVKAWWAGEEFFSVPSDSVPFEVHLWGGSKLTACSWVNDHGGVVNAHLPHTTPCRCKQTTLLTIRVRAFLKHMAML
jgi:hypothetical protein